VETSGYAGTYICNSTAYCLYQQNSLSGVFIHVPAEFGSSDQKILGNAMGKYIEAREANKKAGKIVE
jgi:pyrrolidone-carboxylate peptidase